MSRFVSEDDLDRILLRCAKEDAPAPIERSVRQEQKVGPLTFCLMVVCFAFMPWRVLGMLSSFLMAARSYQKDNKSGG
jgi:hypothetical protein